uniref:Uncharacterized protein n=1 Tax=Anopheles atroparvus TaxID=41427 RepID=A0A182JDY7_ANOAO
MYSARSKVPSFASSSTSESSRSDSLTLMPPPASAFSGLRTSESRSSKLRLIGARASMPLPVPTVWVNRYHLDCCGHFNVFILERTGRVHGGVSGDGAVPCGVRMTRIAVADKLGHLFVIVPEVKCIPIVLTDRGSMPPATTPVPSGLLLAGWKLCWLWRALGTRRRCCRRSPSGETVFTTTTLEPPERQA